MEAMTDVAILLICVFASRWTGNGRQCQDAPLSLTQARATSPAPLPSPRAKRVAWARLCITCTWRVESFISPTSRDRFKNSINALRFRIVCCWVLTLNCLKTLATYPSRSSSPDFRFNAYFFTCMALLILVVLEIRRQ